MFITDVSRSENGNEYTVKDETGAKYVISAGDFKRCDIPFSDCADDYPFEVSSDMREHLAFCESKLRCIKYLQWYVASYGEKSRKRLLEKCRENGYTKQCAESAVTLLCEFGVIDEVASCERRISAYANEKLYGRYRIKSELMAKGYARESIERAFEESEVDYFENAVKMYAKLTRSGIPKDACEKKKLADKMVRYGYSYDEIRYASSCEYDGDY